MRRAAALTGILLVMVMMRVAAVPDVENHRKVLQDTTPVAVNGTIATVLNETKAVGAKGVNATQAAIASGNATANASDNRARGDGWGRLGRGPVVCYESISCRKRMLMQAAAAANETKATGAEGTNATAVAGNATGAATVNASNVTGNATDTRNRRGFNNGGSYYSGSGTYDTFSQADQVHCELVGCKKRRLLTASAAANETKSAANVTSVAVNAAGAAAANATNVTGNASDARSRKGFHTGGNS